MKTLNYILPLVLAGFLFSGCYTQLKVSEPVERDRATTYDSRDAYDLGYGDGWFDAGIYYRDHRRALRSHRFGYSYFPRHYHTFSFGMSFGTYYDPFHFGYGYGFHDPFYYRPYHYYSWRHYGYSPYRPSYVAYNYYYFYDQPSRVTRSLRTTVGGREARDGVMINRSTASRSVARASVGNNVRERATLAQREREAVLNRRSATDLRGVTSRGNTSVRTSGSLNRRGSSATVRSRGTVGRSSSGSTVRSRGTSRSSRDARSSSRNRSSSGSVRSRGSSSSNNSGATRSRSSRSSSSGSSSRNRDRGNDEAMLFHQLEQMPFIRLNIEKQYVEKTSLA